MGRNKLDNDVIIRQTRTVGSNLCDLSMNIDSPRGIYVYLFIYIYIYPYIYIYIYIYIDR